MRSRLTLLLLLWLSPAFAAAYGKGSRVTVPLSDLHPSQMEIGRKEIDAQYDEWAQAAQKKGVSMKHYAAHQLTKKFAHVDLDAIVDPGGNVRPTDGHHRISALLRIADETGVKVAVRVKIVKDYRGKSTAAFAHDFIEKRGMGYFTRSVARLSPEERVEHLPLTFAQLHNSTLRSVLGEMFRTIHVEGLDLVDYAQFKAADWLVDHHLMGELAKAGLVSPSARAFPAALIEDPRANAIVEKMLRSPDGVAFLTTLAIGKDKERVEKRLARN